MKKFLLLVGILLSLQCYAFARDLRDFGNGFYLDVDSCIRDGNYGFAVVEQHSPAIGSYFLVLIYTFDFINNKARQIKVLVLDENRKIVDIIEEFELSKNLQGWQDIVETSKVGLIFRYLKNIDETKAN